MSFVRPQFDSPTSQSTCVELVIDWINSPEKYLIKKY